MENINSETDDSSPDASLPRTPRNSVCSIAELRGSRNESAEPMPSFSPADAGERTSIVSKIEHYKREFPDACALVDLELLRYMNNTTLNEYLMNIRQAVASRNTTIILKTEIDKAIRLCGIACSMWGVQNVHAELNDNQAYRDCLAELSIEYGDIAHIRPEIRLLYILVSTWLEKVGAAATEADKK